MPFLLESARGLLLGVAHAKKGWTNKAQINRYHTAQSAIGQRSSRGWKVAMANKCGNKWPKAASNHCNSATCKHPPFNLGHIYTGLRGWVPSDLNTITHSPLQKGCWFIARTRSIRRINSPAPTTVTRVNCQPTRTRRRLVLTWEAERVWQERERFQKSLIRKRLESSGLR